MTFAPAIWYGGAAQVITGLLQLLRGEKVGGTVFTAFGLNWIATGVLMDPNNASLLEVSYSNDLNEMTKQSGIYFLAWALFALAYLIANLKSTLALISLSCLVCCNYTLLGIFSLTGSVVVEKIAGYFMVVTGINAFYLATAELWKDSAPLQLPLYSVSADTPRRAGPSWSPVAASSPKAKVSGTDASEVS